MQTKSRLTFLLSFSHIFWRIFYFIDMILIQRLLPVTILILRKTKVSAFVVIGRSMSNNTGGEVKGRTASIESESSSKQTSSENDKGVVGGDKIQDDKRRQLDDFQSESLSFLSSVDKTKLNSQQHAIHEAHVCALKEGQQFYQDPATGYQVMTRLAHLQRGKCCGNACRHCPFQQVNAPDQMKKQYNSAFYD